MKKIHIIIIVLVAAAIGIIVATFGDLSTYETFASASEKPGTSFRVVAVLDTVTSKVQYDPLIDPNRLEFYAKDKNGDSFPVVYLGGKPDGFERSEQLVMNGKMTPNGFVCEQIQLKCPSKYEQHEIVVDAKGV